MCTWEAQRRPNCAGALGEAGYSPQFLRRTLPDLVRNQGGQEPIKVVVFDNKVVIPFHHIISHSFKDIAEKFNVPFISPNDARLSRMASFTRKKITIVWCVTENLLWNVWRQWLTGHRFLVAHTTLDRRPDALMNALLNIKETSKLRYAICTCQASGHLPKLLGTMERYYSYT